MFGIPDKVIIAALAFFGGIGGPILVRKIRSLVESGEESAITQQNKEDIDNPKEKTEDFVTREDTESIINDINDIKECLKTLNQRVAKLEGKLEGKVEVKVEKLDEEA